MDTPCLEEVRGVAPEHPTPSSCLKNLLDASLSRNFRRVCNATTGGRRLQYLNDDHQLHSDYCERVSIFIPNDRHSGVLGTSVRVSFPIPKGSTMRTLLSVLFLIVLLIINAVPTSTAESVLPLLRHPYRHLSSLLSPFAVEEDFSDPFKILEHVPFGLERDVQLVTGPARVDWKETPDSHILMLDVLGLKREELKIEVDENRVLRISGERKKEEEKKDDRWHRVDRIYGKFVRLFRLPENVNMDTVKARLENGVLTVALPKLSPDHAKRTPKTFAIESDQGSPKEIIPGRKEGESESKNEL